MASQRARHERATERQRSKQEAKREHGSRRCVTRAAEGTRLVSAQPQHVERWEASPGPQDEENCTHKATTPLPPAGELRFGSHSHPKTCRGGNSERQSPDTWTRKGRSHDWGGCRDGDMGGCGHGVLSEELPGATGRGAHFLRAFALGPHQVALGKSW